MSNDVAEKLIEVGTRVTHYNGGKGTHGQGTVVGHNTTKPLKSLENRFEETVNVASALGLIGAVVDSFYDAERFPHVVQWDNGYKDVYSADSLEVIPL